MPTVCMQSVRPVVVPPPPNVRYIHTRVVRYHPCVVDLRWRRAVHSCDVCPYRTPTVAQSSPAAGRTLLAAGAGNSWCSAVHFGLCSPVKAVGVASPTVGIVNAVAAANGASAPRPESPPPPPLPAKRRIQIPIIVKSAGGAREVNVQQQQQQQPLIVPVVTPGERRDNSVAVVVARSEPEALSESFLRKKEAELRQKREREKLSEQQQQLQQQQQDVAAIQSVASRPRRPDQDLPLPTSQQLPDSTCVVTSPVTLAPVTPAAAEPGDGDGMVKVTSNAVPVDKLEFVAVPVSVAATISSDDALLTNSASPRTIGTTPLVATKTPKVVTPPSEPVLTTSVVASSSITPLPSGGDGSTIPRLTSLPESGSVVNIPQFYFPVGMPTVPATGGADVVAETVLQRVKEEFEKVEGGKVLKNQVGPIVKALGLPLYWKCPFFNFTGGDKMGHVTLQAGLAAWKKLVSNCHDESSRFLRLVAKPGRQFVEFDDFLPLIQDVVDTHPGLTFLQDAPEFHSRYVQTVISRIFYTVNRSWSSRITLPEIRKSNFLETVRRLEVEDDINQITDYFSYEHFYVIYCKFWELDKDHDLLISKEDLSRHNDHAISSRIIDRIFSGAVTRNLVDGKLCYKDFVWFLMSEEDKRNPRSIEYWFRCMDLDGDGIISMYEMEYFYEEQVEKMEMLGIETLPFQDCLCQMLDMVRPKEEGKIRLKDLKACSLTPIYFDTFINLDKYLEHEQKDPFASLRDQDSDEPEPSDWERYAAEEYELLVAEEGTAEVQQDAVYEDELEPDLSTTEGSTQPTTKKTSSSTVSSTSQGRSAAATKNDDIYDFSNTDVGY